MNQVTVLRQDKNEATLNLNGLMCHVAKMDTGRYLSDGFTAQRWLTALVCYPWNMSNRQMVQAATLKALVGKLEKMEQVQPYSATGRRVLA